MNILLVNYEYPPLGGGAGNATQALAREFVSLGHNPLVLTSRFRGLPAEEDSQGVAVRRIPVWRRRIDRCTPLEMLTYIASGCRQILPVARAFRPAVTLAFFGIPGGPVAYWLKTRCGIPYVLSLRGGDVPGHVRELSLHHAVTRPFIRALWKGASALVANSQGLADLARQTLPDASFHVIPNGVDTRQFRPPAEPRPSGSAGPRLLYVGRLSREKGLEVLLLAVAGLNTPGPIPPWTLQVVGDGPDRPRLEALADRHGLRNRIHWCGWMDRRRIAGVYADSDIFVFPSHGEGMPNSLLEAMACGLPAVTTRVRGIVDLLQDGVQGLLHDPGDAAGLQTRLRDLMATPALRQRLGAAARARAEEFSWSGVARRYLDLLQPASLR